MPTLYIAGDSTAATYPFSDAPQTGWGQVLHAHFIDSLRVDNRATCARSSKSFIGEGRLSAIEETLEKGDYLFIQFTHNDNTSLFWRHTEPMGSFRNCLDVYIDTARHYGAHPVLLTPICQRLFDESGHLTASHADYVQAIELTGRRKGVPVIDVYTQSMKAVAALGDGESKRYYMHLAPGENPNHPSGLCDNTHTTLLGARMNADIVARGIRDLPLPIAHFLKEDCL